MGSTDTDWDEVGKALQRDVRAAHVKDYIKEPLENIINPLFKGGEIPLFDSTDLILTLIFINIDLLGYLYKGEGKSICAVEFMRKYLGEVDTRYEEVGGLLYDALRHGYIHLATPKRIGLQDGKILDFSFTVAGQRQDHLKVTKREELERVGRVEICRLNVNLSILYEDLLSAMDKYAEDIRHNQALSDTFRKAFETRRQPQKAKEEALLGRTYIRESDFGFIRKQIANL